MEETEKSNKFTILEDNNIHTIILRLKEFKYKTKKITNLETLDLLISEVKEFIYKIPTIQKIYGDNINVAKTYIENNKEELDKISESLNQKISSETKDKHAETIEQYKQNEITITSIVYHNLPIFYYFDCLKFVMGEQDYNIGFDINKIEVYCGVKNFYKKNMEKYFSYKYTDILQINRKIKDIYSIIFNDVGIKKVIDYYALELENYIVLDTVPLYGEFLTKFLHSALYGMLDSIEKEVKTYLKDKNIDKNINEQIHSKNEIPKELQKATDQQKFVFQIFYKKPNTTVISAVTHYNEINKTNKISSSRMNDIIENICNFLGLKKTNITELREYINSIK